MTAVSLDSLIDDALDQVKIAGEPQPAPAAAAAQSKPRLYGKEAVADRIRRSKQVMDQLQDLIGAQLITAAGVVFTMDPQGYCVGTWYGYDHAWYLRSAEFGEQTAFLLFKSGQHIDSFPIGGDAAGAICRWMGKARRDADFSYDSEYDDDPLADRGRGDDIDDER